MLYLRREKIPQQLQAKAGQGEEGWWAPQAEQGGEEGEETPKEEAEGSLQLNQRGVSYQGREKKPGQGTLSQMLFITNLWLGTVPYQLCQLPVLLKKFWYW